MSETIRIPKRSGTHADVLAAVGLADLLGSAFRQHEKVRIEEGHDAFLIHAPGGVDGAIRERLPHTPGYRFLREKGEPVPAGVDFCDYEEERDRAKRFREMSDALRKEGKGTAEITELLAQQRPSRSWRREQVVRLLQGHSTANKLARQVAESDTKQFRDEVAGAVARLAQGVPSGLRWKTEQVQVFNPPAAKGYARLKPDSTDRNDGTSDGWGDPLLDWLRIRGFHRAAAPFYFGSKGEHIRILFPVPAAISMAALSAVMDEFQSVGIHATAEPKLDALAVLGLTRILLEHCTENSAARPELPRLFSLRGSTPRKVIAGVVITHYQSLGQSRAVGSLQRLGLPAWFRVEGAQDVTEWFDILEEHRRAIRCLEDKHSDEIGIVLAYRRFLQGQDDAEDEPVAEAFLEFLGQYGCFLIRAREAKRRVPQFTTRNVRRVLMGVTKSYTAILDNEGFQALARAVRHCTVSAQAQRVMGGKDVREIRYDLVPDLRRKRSLSADDFMTAMGEFVSHYNIENARRQEMKKGRTPRITTEQFHQFAALVEQHGADKVGALLCAYGTCREPSDTEEPAVVTGAEDASPEE